MSSTPVISKVASFSSLDDLLDSIGVKLQISKTAYESAKNRYRTIGEWLRAEESPIAEYKPDIFSQGSLRIRTTVKPTGEEEYDLDLVCLLNTQPSIFTNATELLDLIEDRLNSNKTYDGMIERKNRCIRVNYANEFHMDILPACPDPLASELHGEHCLLVPDCDLEDWKHSNPKGYALWFEDRARRAMESFRKNIEPLPEQTAYEDLETLNRVVQLMKRHRDTALTDLKVNERPISIVLTTLAGTYYDGNPSVIAALENILLKIQAEIEEAAARGADRIIVCNPTHTSEELSERWKGNPSLYKNFTDWIADFIELLTSLRKQPGLPEVAAQLKEMFGESVTNEVVKDFTKRTTELRHAGKLATSTGTGLLVTIDSPRSTPVKINNFHGDD